MVRGIQSFNQNFQQFTQKVSGKNVKKAVELPAKISLAALGSFGIIKNINENSQTDAFIAKCSNYDSETIGDCVTMAYSVC